MKVKTIYLIIPIVAIFLLIAGATYLLQLSDVGSSSLGYEYKEKFFNKDELSEVSIKVDEADWDSLLSNPTAEEYFEATVTLNGVTYEHVGVRAKGNSSLSSVASSESNRYSLKLDFSQYDNNQSYYGLEKINLNNNFSDTTQMKEYVSYELMNQLDIPTPAYAYAKVHVNGQYYGLMLAVEEIGEAFVRTHYNTSEGYIFKPEGDGSDLKYVSDQVSDYSGIFNEVKYNKETAEQSSNIITMMKQISEGDTSALQLDLIARYFALNTALVNMDSYQGSFKHNYYLYEDKNGMFSIIPWDYNMSFGGFTGMGGGNRGEFPNMRQSQARPQRENDNQIQFDASQQAEQQQPIRYNMGQRPNGMGNGLNISQSMMTSTNINFSITNPVSGTTIDERPLLKIILEDEKARVLYEQYLEQIATSLLTEANISGITSKLQDLLLNAVESDPSKFSTTEQFIAGVKGDESLAAFAKARSVATLSQLNGTKEVIEAVAVNTVNTTSVPKVEANDNNKLNASTQSLEMPQFAEGEMPNPSQMPQFAEGEMPDPSQMPQFAEGEMPQFAEGEIPGPPQFGGNQDGQFGFPGLASMDRTNANQGNSSSTPIVVQYVIAAMSLLIAVIVIVLMSSRKYKKGGK